MYQSTSLTAVPAGTRRRARPERGSHSLRRVQDEKSSVPERAPEAEAPGVGALDGVSAFMGLRWDDPETVRLKIRPELINAGGLLSGVVTYAMVDYCMGSTLWARTTAEERIATISISINYVATATEGELVCRTVLDRRNRSNAVMKSEIRSEDGRLLVTAIGSYAIFTKVPRSSTHFRDASRS
jgi:acyl-coenzyme A thioesterase PaaI-like protein